MIQEATLIEAILSIRSQVDFLWQFFVTVHIAIFALLFIYDDAVESLNVVARAFALGGVALFEWINGKALTNTYLLLDATLDQYRALYGEVEPLPAGLFPAFCRPDLQRPPGDGPPHAQHGVRRHPAGAAVARVHSDAQEPAAGSGELMRSLRTDAPDSVAELT